MQRFPFAVCFASTVALLTGCSTTYMSHYRGLTATDKADKEKAKAALNSDYNDVSSECFTEAKRLKAVFGNEQYTTIAIASVGIVAGGIAVPALVAKAAAKSAIAAAGGISGVSSALLLDLNQNGQSPTATAQVASQLRDQMKQGLDSYAAATNDVERQQALNALKLACTFDIPNAQALNSANVPSAPSNVTCGPGSANGKVKFTFNSPTLTGTAPITGYTITAKSGSASTVNFTVADATAASDLAIAAGTYSGSIVAHNINGDGPPATYSACTVP